MQESIRKSEERQAFLLKLSDTQRPLVSPAEIQFTAARLLGEHLRVNRVVYADIEDGQYIMRQSWTNGVAPFDGRCPVIIFGETLLGSNSGGETVIVSDVRTDSRFAEPERSTLLAGELAVDSKSGMSLAEVEQWIGEFIKPKAKG